MIVHFMVLQLNYAAISSLYYSLIIDVVNFDLVPVEHLHPYFFGFDNTAWSAQARFIGYESRFFIENTGSLIYIYLLLIFLQLIYMAMTRAFGRTTKVYKFAK